MEEQTNKVMAALETLTKELKEMGVRMTGMETTVGSLQTSVDSLQTDVQKSQKNLEMAMTTVGSVEQEQIAMGRSVQQLQRASPPTAASLLINRTGLPTGPPLLAGSGVLGPNATTVQPPPTAPVGAAGASAAATTTQIPGHDTSHTAKVTNHELRTDLAYSSEVEQHGRRNMPKMDFPKFSGVDARIWIDQCNTYFLLYNIPEGFKVSAATMNFIEPASHWYHSLKLERPYLTWDQLQAAVVAEFEVNTCRD